VLRLTSGLYAFFSVFFFVFFVLIVV